MASRVWPLGPTSRPEALALHRDLDLAVRGLAGRHRAVETEGVEEADDEGGGVLGHLLGAVLAVAHGRLLWGWGHRTGTRRRRLASGSGLGAVAVVRAFGIGRSVLAVAARRRGVGRAGLVLAAPIPAVPPLDLRSRCGRAYPRPHARLTPDAAEQPGPRLLQDLELGVALVHAQLVERVILGFFGRPTGRLHPLHGDCFLAPSGQGFFFCWGRGRAGGFGVLPVGRGGGFGASRRLPLLDGVGVGLAFGSDRLGRWRRRGLPGRVAAATLRCRLRRALGVLGVRRRLRCRRLPGDDGVRVLLVEALRYVSLLTDPEDVLHQEVPREGGRNDEREHAGEDREDLHDHLLLRGGRAVVDRRVVLVPGGDLALLDEVGDHDDGHQDQVGERLDEGVLQRLSGRVGQVQPERPHLRRVAQVLVQLRAVVEVLRGEERACSRPTCR